MVKLKYYGTEIKNFQYRAAQERSSVFGSKSELQKFPKLENLIVMNGFLD